MWNGVPERLPVGIIDNDNSNVSRSLIRTLNTMSAVHIEDVYDSYTDARQAMQKNKIYAFMIIPEGFENKSMSGKQPDLPIFTNAAYFVAGVVSF